MRWQTVKRKTTQDEYAKSLHVTSHPRTRCKQTTSSPKRDCSRRANELARELGFMAHATASKNLCGPCCSSTSAMARGCGQVGLALPEKARTPDLDGNAGGKNCFVARSAQTRPSLTRCPPSVRWEPGRGFHRPIWDEEPTVVDAGDAHVVPRFVSDAIQDLSRKESLWRTAWAHLQHQQNSIMLKEHCSATSAHIGR